MIRFALLDKSIPYDDLLGFLPSFLDEADPRPAAAQIDENYAHGGGWRPQAEWKMDPVSRRIVYPGDPPLWPLAVALMREERLFFYDHAFLAIVQPDETFAIARID